MRRLGSVWFELPCRPVQSLPLLHDSTGDVYGVAAEESWSSANTSKDSRGFFFQLREKASPSMCTSGLQLFNRVRDLYL
jgi:hypothetical protein